MSSENEKQTSSKNNGSLFSILTTLIFQTLQFLWYYARDIIRTILIKIVREGPIPRHVSIIMDGNRRFAKSKHMEVLKGHHLGFETLKDVLNVCLDLGVKEVSVYAFSIENFKRPKHEVDGLFDLAKSRWSELVESPELKENDVRIRVIGDLAMLPPDVQKVVSKTILETKDRKGCILNVCMAYTSRHEILSAIKELSEGVQENFIEPSDVTEDLFERCLYTSSVPDILIRTSGETRLSDYMLWQSSFSPLTFLKVLWPALSYFHVIYIVLMYQFYSSSSRKLYQQYQEDTQKHELEMDLKENKQTQTNMNSEFWKERQTRQRKFLQIRTERNIKQLQQYCTQQTKDDVKTPKQPQQATQTV